MFSAKAEIRFKLIYLSIALYPDGGRGTNGKARKDHPPKQSGSTRRGGWHGKEPFGPLCYNAVGGHFRVSGVKRLFLLTSFGAAKEVSAAPHRGQ